MEKLSFRAHCALAFLVRLILVIYANFHDKTFGVPFTDVDYKVFTDAARYIVEEKSPFERHTYRYSPLLALILTPNILLNKDFGKVLFSLVDVVVALLMKRILTRQNCNENVKLISIYLWLYNPLTIVISTRGNADSLAVLLVVLTLDFLQRDKFIIAGLLHGLSIHFRLYPIVFSMAMYLSICKTSYFIPHKNQVKLIFSCVLSIIVLTAVNYYFYGYKYLYESILYHIIRKDTRHNFSVYFYMLYLSSDRGINVIQKVLTLLPQLVLLLILSYKYSSKRDLPFAMFTQAVVMVIYNPVLTSQYFFWFLSLLPLCLPRLGLSIYRSLYLCIAWILSQGLWLLAAYILEFEGLNTFVIIWITGLLFFSINIKILNDILVHYK